MQKVDLRIDVSTAAALGVPIKLAATAFLPETLRPGRPVIVFAVPGGGYARGYFDMHFDGHEGYSQAEHHCAKGLVLVAIDHVGVGDSSQPEPAAIRLETLAATHDAAARKICALFAEGAVHPALPKLASPLLVGIGQSMGGCVTILAQGLHATFDAIAPLGYSAIHTFLPHRTSEESEAGVRVYAEVSRGSATRPVSEYGQDDYVYPFHWEDVPADILAADMDGGFPLRTTAPPFGSLTIPPCAVEMMVPGVVASEAAAVRVPVFAGNGERDVCVDPRAEPAAYRGTNDITTVIIPRMAHMHNFAGTRQKLWNRLLWWITGLEGA